MQVSVKSPKEIEILSEGGKILAHALRAAAEKAKDGVSTAELDECARKEIVKAGAKPAFLNYSARMSGSPFPASLCVSINDEVVHGIPDKDRVVKEGDIVSLDLGVEYKGLFTDAAISIGVGKMSEEAKRLLDITKESLHKGIQTLNAGARLGDYGSAVQAFVEKAGFSVVRQLVGHGVGYAVHEDPDIPNWGQKGKGMRIKTGMVFALEPMVCAGSEDVYLDNDGWTWKTKDGSLSAHFEHTIAIGKEATILTKGSF